VAEKIGDIVERHPRDRLEAERIWSPYARRVGDIAWRQGNKADPFIARFRDRSQRAWPSSPLPGRSESEVEPEPTPRPRNF
jgi:hypothetical protein